MGVQNQVDLYEGDVVIITTTGQCGTLYRLIADKQIMVILRNNDIWTGSQNLVYFTEDLEEQLNAPIDAPRFEPFFKDFRSNR